MNTYSKNHMYNLCKHHLKQHVLVETHHGEKIQGVIIDLDDENIYLVTPVMQEQRQFYPSYYGYAPYGYGYPYGFGLRRLILPLTAIAALSLLPWY